MSAITGGCACGGVRFHADADPTFVAVCHCRGCQRRSGSAFGVIVALPATSLKIDGSLTIYDSTGDSGKGVHDRFCPRCGSQVARNVDVFPDLMMIRAGVLDDPSWVKPAMEIYCGEKQPWVGLGGEMKRFEKMPG